MVLFFQIYWKHIFLFFYILDGCSKQASCFSKRKNSASIYFTDKILTGKVQKHLTKSNCSKMKLVRLDFSRPNFVREVDRSKILEEFYKISNAIWFLWTFHYRKVASSRLSQLAAHFQTVYEDSGLVMLMYCDLWTKWSNIE